MAHKSALATLDSGSDGSLPPPAINFIPHKTITAAGAHPAKRPMRPKPNPYTPPPPTKQQRTKPPAPKDLRLALVYFPIQDSLAENPAVDTVLLSSAFPVPFSTETVAAGLANGCTTAALHGYLSSYPAAQLNVGITDMVKGCHPVLFYALERNDVSCVKVLVDYGCDVKACDYWGVPALAYGIMRSKWTVENPTEVVKTLLGYGADPNVVPRDMWEYFLEPPSATPPVMAEGKEVKPEKATLWCEPHHRKILADTLNLSVRYFLSKAHQVTPTEARGMQLAQAHNYVPLLKAPYLVVGQTFACNFVVEHVTSHIGMSITSPLVLTFAGLSGHGKTELAKQMGELLNIPMTVIDCAQMRTEIDLFGVSAGYKNGEKGSQLNNHLAQHDGQRTVVFMDEFDKTDGTVHNALLLLLDSGEYHDRRDNHAVDASKVIWILATNLGDVAITTFYRDRIAGLKTSAEKSKIPHKLLQNQLKQVFRDHFGAPIAGRMKNVAPFYPFDRMEQAVVVHKFLTGLVDQLRLPIDLSPAVNRYPGHVHLEVKNDGKLCMHTAKECYIAELGARSLTSGIDDLRREFYGMFVDSEELVREEMNEGPLMKYAVQLVPVVGGSKDEQEVTVSKEGLVEYYKGQSSRDPKEDIIEEQVDELDGLFGRITTTFGAG
jgi:hypothetical protein